jgi:hypothetical protein
MPWLGHARLARLLRRSRSRSASPPSPARSGGPRAAGSRTPTRTQPTSTRSTRAVTSPRGKSPSSSPPRCGLHTAHCANERHCVRLSTGGGSLPTQATDPFLLIGTRLANGVRSTRRPGLRNERNAAATRPALPSNATQRRRLVSSPSSWSGGQFRSPSGSGCGTLRGGAGGLSTYGRVTGPALAGVPS